MRLSNAQRELVLELVTGLIPQLPELLTVWQEAGDKDPPTEPAKPQLFTTIRRLPADMKTEDGSFRYAQPAPFAGATAERVTYFYEPAASPSSHPTVLVVTAWSVPAAAVVESPTGTGFDS